MVPKVLVSRFDGNVGEDNNARKVVVHPFVSKSIVIGFCLCCSRAYRQGKLDNFHASRSGLGFL